MGKNKSHEISEVCSASSSSTPTKSNQDELFKDNEKDSTEGYFIIQLWL